MSAQLWSETVRTDERANCEYMVFPRVLAAAERAWHRADWKTTTKWALNTLKIPT
ncbi:family 20 glycosylhydrolase [Vibrio lentus]|nr:family 20 glycosylhydrolase [Vibrio lentus]